jgi:hypothetical protein
VRRELGLDQLRAVEQELPRGTEEPDHLVEANPGEADPALQRCRGVAHQNQLQIRVEDVAGPLREAALQPDVDRPPQVAGREARRFPGVQGDGAGGDTLQHPRQVQRRRWLMLVKEAVVLPVTAGVEGEVVRPRRLARGHRGHELVLGHWTQGVVGQALLSQRRAGLARQLLAAGRTGGVGGEDPGLVREAQDPLVQRSVQKPRQRVRREPGAR